MSRPNLPTLRSIAVDPLVLVNLPLDAIDALLTECEAETKIVSAAKKAIIEHVTDRYAKAIAGAYSAQGKDFGTIRVADQGYDVVVDTPKRVDWDQAQLADIRSRIQFSGDDPSEYIKVKYDVSETSYGAWPEHIRRTFEPARTVKPGSVSVKLVRKEAA